MSDERLRELERAWSGGDEQAGEAYCAELLRGVSTRRLVEHIISQERLWEVWRSVTGTTAMRQTPADIREALARPVTTEDIIRWVRGPEPERPRSVCTGHIACPGCGAEKGEPCDTSMLPFGTYTCPQRMAAYRRRDQGMYTTAGNGGSYQPEIDAAIASVVCPVCDVMAGEPCDLPEFVRDRERCAHTQRVVEWRRLRDNAHTTTPEWIDVHNIRELRELVQTLRERWAAEARVRLRPAFRDELTIRSGAGYTDASLVADLHAEGYRLDESHEDHETSSIHAVLRRIGATEPVPPWRGTPQVTESVYQVVAGAAPGDVVGVCPRCSGCGTYYDSAEHGIRVCPCKRGEP